MRGEKGYIRGIKTGFPVAVGYFPIAIAFGALAIQADLNWIDATFMSILVYAGASQFMGISMLLTGVGVTQIIFATFFLNLRHLIMSLAVNHQYQRNSKTWMVFLSFFITDETFALLTVKDDNQAENTGYLTGVFFTAYGGWVLGTAVGSLGAGLFNQDITAAMTVGLYGLFIGLLVPPVKKSIRLAIIAGIAMILNWALSLVLDQGWALVWAIILAAALGAILIKEEN
jgi:4-azaleucine resistance transporter AzlC